MNLIPRKTHKFLDPFSELEQLHSRINNLFGWPFSDQASPGSDLIENNWAPAIDVFDEKEQLVVRADIPGLTKDEIRISVENNMLVIQGEKKREEEKKEKNYYRCERFYGRFYRAIALPANTDTAKIDANYKNGVLEVRVAKKEEMKPKQIDIKIDS